MLSSTPAATAWGEQGTQIMPFDKAVVPPSLADFSQTRTFRPDWAANRAADRPAAPLPTATTSNTSSQVSPAGNGALTGWAIMIIGASWKWMRRQSGTGHRHGLE